MTVLSQISAIVKGSANRHGFPENVAGFLGVAGATEINPVTGLDDPTLQYASDAIANGILASVGGQYVLYSSNIADFAATVASFGSLPATIYVNSDVVISENLDIAALAPNLSIVGMVNGKFTVSATKNINVKAFDSFGLVLGTMFAGAGTFSFASPVRVVGAGSPESVITAPVGSEYLRTDGGVSSVLYIKESGSGNTGWISMATSGLITGCVILAPDSSVRNRITPTNPAYVPLTIRGAVAQSANLFVVENSAGTSLFTVGAAGDIVVNTNKFTVAAASGNTIVAGTLTATGGVWASGGFTNNASYTTAIFNAEATGTTYFIGRDGATIKYSMAPTLFTIAPNVALAGRLNINGATDAANYALNVYNSSISATRVAGFGGNLTSYGLGSPGAANIELVELLHDGTGGAILQVGTGGSGTQRPFYIKIGGATAITVAIDQVVSLSNNLNFTSPYKTIDFNPVLPFTSYIDCSDVSDGGSPVYDITIATPAAGRILFPTYVQMDGGLFASQQVTFGNALRLNWVAYNQAVFSDGTGNLVSKAVTGTGSVAMSTNPTFNDAIGVLSNTSANINNELNSTNTNAPIFRSYKSRGTNASKTDVGNGDYAAAFASSVWSGGAYYAGAEIDFVVDGTFTSGQRPPSRMEFWTNLANTAQTLNMVLDSEGRLTLSGVGSVGNVVLNVSSSRAGAYLTTQIQNTSTAANSHARLLLRTGGTAAGDPYIHYYVETASATEWAVGLDNSDNDAFVWSNADTPGTNNRMRLNTAGDLSVYAQFEVAGRSAFAGSGLFNYIAMRVGDATISTQGGGAYQYGIVVNPKSGTDASTRYSSLYVGADAGTSSTAELNSLLIVSAIKDSGTVANNIGLNIQNQTVGSSNWSIKTGTGLVEIGDNIKLAGRLNINGASDTATAGVNVKNANVVVSGGYGSFVYGVGVPGDADTEYFASFHNGTQSVLYSGKTGTGSVRSIHLVLEGNASGLVLNSVNVVGIYEPLICRYNTSTTAGGEKAIVFGTSSDAGIAWGSGAPTISAKKGCLYLRTDGSGTNNRSYINTDGGTTWTALVTVA